MNHLGIDIGGTYIKYALVNQDFLIIDKWKKPTHQFLTKDEFYDYLCQDIDVKDIDFVGVSTAGIIDAVQMFYLKQQIQFVLCFKQILIKRFKALI